MEVWLSPAADHAEALAAYRDAVAAEPVPERTDTRTASVIERDELLALVEAIYAADTDQDRQEATDAALADPEAALTCYRAIANERGIVVARTDARQSSAQSARQSAQQSARESAKQSAHESARQSAARGCSTCRHRKRPGLSAGYCGGGRDDLPAAYGLHHPLRKLPADQGASCASYLPHEGANHA
jgi:cobalamin biosynthesis Mg chelatase CobN